MRLSKKVFLVSLVISMITLVLDLVNVGDKLCSSYSCRSLLESNLLSLFSITCLISLFSLFLIFSKESTFLYWWKFARVATPLVLVASILLNIDSNNTQGGILMNFNSEFNQVLISLMYLTFILGSAWQMYRGFKQK
jgi:hypothetical protein